MLPYCIAMYIHVTVIRKQQPPKFYYNVLGGTYYTVLKLTLYLKLRHTVYVHSIAVAEVSL